MLISPAFATAETQDTAVAVGNEVSGGGNLFMSNMLLIVVLVAMFYLLLIRPQQKRFAAHNEMLAGLQKGDKVVTSGGLIGTIDKLVNDKEAIVDLGNGMKVTAVKNTLQRHDDKPALAPAKKDAKKDVKKDKAAEKAAKDKK
jgi:preprotein translocase subunit YajC